MNHIEVDIHFIKKKIDSGLITIPHVTSKNQLNDVLTKGLSTSRFQEIIDKFGMEDIHPPA